MDGLALELAFAIILVVLLTQSLMLLYGAWRLRRQFSELDRNLDSMASKVSRSVEKLSGLVARIAEGTNSLAGWDDRLRSASTKVMQAVRAGDEAVGRMLDGLRGHTRRIDSQLDAGIQSFSHYSYKVHRAIVHPAHKVSEALNSMTASVRRFFSRGNSSLPPEFVAEEEEFI